MSNTDLNQWRRHIASEHGPESPTRRLLLLALSLRAVKGHIAQSIESGWLTKEQIKAEGRGKGWRRVSYQASLPKNVVHLVHHETIEGSASGAPANSYRGAPDSIRGASGAFHTYIRTSQELASKKQHSFLLKDGNEFLIDDDLVKVLSEAYPLVDLEKEIRAIRAWCATNPEKRKTRRGARAFVNRWMQRAQNNGSNQAESTPKGFAL